MILKSRFFFYYTIVFAMAVNSIQAQEHSDSLLTIDSAITSKVIKKNQLLDSLRKTASDTVASEAGLDTLIFYGADTTEGTLSQSTVILKNNAWVKYRGMEITAAKIIINQPLKLMTAEAVPDSLDSLGDVARYKGIPKFSEGGESFTGNTMEYNFETRRGRVVMGETKMQDGIYYGENIRKIGENTLYIRRGRFTTCDEKEPHFYFQSKEMKLIVKDKVVAKPVILYIHDVPIFAIPFGVFPNRSGRASGITPPVYTETPREGKQIRNFGYFWAPNDYFDALGQIDFLDKAGFLFHGGTRYSKRYSYSGNFQFSYSSLSYITGEKSRLWNIDASHSQTISDKQNLNADIHYVSSNNFYQNTSVNQQQILNRQIRTNVSYNNTQDWGSFSANFSQSKNLDNGQKDLTFPNISINKSNSAFFPKSEKDKNKPDTWYQSIRYSYSSNILGRQSQADRTADPASALGMNHNVGINAPFKVLKYFSVNPSLNIQETWFDRRNENFRYDPDNNPVSDTVRSFYARHTFSSSVGMSTKIYGTANPKLFGLETFRHVMSPSVSLSYQPDFSTSPWGYYETAVDTAGHKVKFDRYGGNILFGGTPQGKQLAMGFNLAHTLQAKVKSSEKDTAGVKTSKEPELKKLDLLNINNSISYNFEAQHFKLSQLTTSISVSNDLAKNLSLSLSMTHDFYRFDKALNQRVDKLNKIPRLISASITSGVSFSGGETKAATPSTTDQNVSDQTQNYSTQPFQQDYNQRFLPQNNAISENVPWSLRFDFNYDINKSNPSVVTKAFGVNINSSLKITPNWQMGYNARYDILNKSLVSQSFSFTRDLHCWQMRFDWTPTGPAAGYFFVIQVKSATLQDVKLQRTDYGSRIFQ